MHPSFFQIGQSPGKEETGEEAVELEKSGDEVKFSASNESPSQETTLLNGGHCPPTEEKTPSSAAHSRQGSQVSTTSTDNSTLKSAMPSMGLGDCHRGLIVGLHRKMVSFADTDISFLWIT